MQKKTAKALGVAAGALVLAAGVTALVLKRRRTIPKGITAVNPFDLERYLGKWYEIARLNYRYERGLDHTTAEYTRNADGSVTVVNEGQDKNSHMVSVRGKAVPAGPEGTGMLKVSFFGPFYAGYNVIAIDDEYQHALVCGHTRDYLWLLSREQELPEAVQAEYLAKAKALGFDVEKLVWPEQYSQSTF